MNAINFNQTRQYSHGGSTVALTNDQLRYAAPSIFATEPWHAMSDKYAFIPTVQVLDKLREEGFVPVKAIQSKTRIAGKGEFTKHQIRLRQIGNTSSVIKVGDIVPEVVITNAHDGASRYVIEGGLYRFICANGLMVADGIIQALRTRHTGNVDDVIDATFSIIEEMPKALASVENFRQLQLAPPEQQAFAEAALSLRYDEGEAPITAQQVLTPRRAADRGTDLWTTYNVAQENLVSGGLRGRNPESLCRARTRAVQGISENTKLNKALWSLTEKMAELKAN